jgi:hypothetical protein
MTESPESIVPYPFARYPPAVHPPPFRRQQRLSDWSDCRLELHCCRGQSVIPVRLLIRDHGDRTFIEVLAKLRCRQCRKPPGAIELVPAPYPEGRNQTSSISGGSARLTI